ncbi:MAG: nucleoside triphosphate pyrophosphohydrolase family protein [Opitutales bacterium]
MSNFEHSTLVSDLKKSSKEIINELKPEQADALHMAIGIAGEAGELLDAIKKWAIYQKPLDLENVIEELGDLEFYMEGLRQSLNLTRIETLMENIAKLQKRYSKGEYSNEQANERADKAQSQQK